MSLRMSAFLFTFVIVFVGIVRAQPAPSCGGNNFDGYKIRSVKVDARFASVTLPPKGTPITSATIDTDSTLQKLNRSVQEALKQEELRETITGATLFQITGKLSTVSELKSITPCIAIIDEQVCLTEVGQKKCVDVTISAKTIRFDPNNPSASFLSAIPRSSTSTMFSNVPKPLLILNPNFGIDFDKRFGLSQSVKVSTNLLDVNELFEGKNVRIKSTRLDVKAEGRKSLNRSFYNSAVGISISKFLPSRFAEYLSFTAKFSAAKLPNGDSAFLQNAVSIDGSVLLKPTIDFIKSLFLQGGYARENNRRIGINPAESIRTRENNFHFRILINGQIKRDVLRVGLWADSGRTTSIAFSYNRFAGLVGYAKDFGRGNQTFGLETMFGGGKVSGIAPEYAYFWGSSELKNFMYEANDSDILQRMPAGPVIRSFGNGQAVNSGAGSLSGSKSYWSFNLNVSIPVKQWSSPLIPNETVDLDEGVPDPDCSITTIRDLIKCQAKSGEVLLGAIYKKQGVTNFAQKAKKEFKSINSSVKFLTDHANLYSVKPLFMLDVANFNGPFGLNKTRLGVGGGLQFTIVIAKFEAGYLRTINPQIGDSRGNFIMRLNFQNLF